MNRRVLCVDDEPQVLGGLRRGLSDDYEVSTAPDGAQAVETLKSSAPFAIVMSDMRMPGMDGAALLGWVRQHCPDSTRILLTGYADIDSAINAVNQGNIFRFLVKPCPDEILRQSLDAGLEQYRLITAEKELLEKTLGGALSALMEVLGLVAPDLFARSARLEQLMQLVVRRLKLEPAWIYETAAKLSQLGLIALPKEVVDRVVSAVRVTDRDRLLFESHPETASRILRAIPRLEPVADIIRHQFTRQLPDSDRPEVTTGVNVLRVVVAVDSLIQHGSTPLEAVEAVYRRGIYDQEILDALLAETAALSRERGAGLRRSVGLGGLEVGMVLVDNVCSSTGTVVVPAGRVVTVLILERLQKFAQGVGLTEPFRVE
jgi:response regulator RpfG family c-di-GMP phosphodiesterase